MRKTLLAMAFVAAGVLVTAVPAAASTGHYGPKGNPNLVHANGIDALTFIYGYAAQSATADGSSATMTVAQPTLAAADFHSLAEIAAESADGQQIVEVGWNVDRGLNGDAAPHLFVFHWVNGTATCYNGCGFVPVGPPMAGMTVPTGNAQFAIQHFQGNWWLGYNNTWFGYFPDSLWNGTYTKVGLTQWFGEVAANSASPCTDMGNGLFASSVSAATISGIGFFNGPAVNFSANATNPALYTVNKTDSTTMRFGGPGAC
ncbi:neprosin family prolyl endopeptidase [Actinocrispum wychmicini]|uniref:Uncharacterized protein DUF239 n=1 Tax=Actinocrispum wychmicini TaxID=1213861 RepID=A0A4R2JF43_9PSEU|nr:neprosin family prolyl endopeptidase [Actinocrispum wychmicini]TCO54879.1 uncharacterized protein DUF239 [Actinocrispum wychmicini]